MLQSRILSEMNGINVYTDSGEIFGEVIDAVIQRNRICAWKIRASQGSGLFKMLRGAKGVIVPHQLVKSIGDIMIISSNAIPIRDSGSNQMMDLNQSHSTEEDGLSEENFL